MRFIVAMAVVVLALGVGCGSPALRCEAPSLPSPTPAYTDTLVGLVVTPARSSMRDASAGERDAFEALTVRTVQACDDAAAPGADCALGTLRAKLTTLAAPDHPALFTDIDAALDPSLTSAHGDFALASRDCGGRDEQACDAWLVARAFARALCDLAETEGG